MERKLALILIFVILAVLVIVFAMMHHHKNAVSKYRLPEYGFTVGEIRILAERNCIFFSLLLVVYSVWRYFKQRKTHMLYFTLSFVFLTLSATLLMLSSTMYFYGIYFNISMLKLLELSGLAFFVCFTICTVIALKKIGV